MPIPTYIRDLRAIIGHDLIMAPGAAAIICDDSGKILLQKRTDNGKWGLPGGMPEPGETPAEAVVREAYEETGLTVRPESIVGLYRLQVTYPNGDQIAGVSTTFVCQIIAGEPTVTGDETLDVRYFSPDALPKDILPAHIPRIQDFVNGRMPYFKKPENGILQAKMNYVQAIRARVGQEFVLQLMGSVAIIRDEAGHILLGLREDGRGWGLPGGVLEPGETPADGVVRETYEEMGLHVEPMRLVGVYSGEKHRSETAFFTGYFFECQIIGGELVADGTETLDVRYFAPDNLPQHMLEQHREPIRHALNRETPYF